MSRVDGIAKGRVQGVGYRWFVQRHAMTLGLRGWVRNRPDGNVEFVAVGERPQLERLLEVLRRGPSLSQVDDVEVRWSDGETDRTGFEITY